MESNDSSTHKSDAGISLKFSGKPGFEFGIYLRKCNYFGGIGYVCAHSYLPSVWLPRKLGYCCPCIEVASDKHKGDNAVTEKFQLINEAYKVLSDPAKRLDYDLTGNYEIDKYTYGNILPDLKE
ncbi:hypothetical protein CK203_099178 [Vitis vinifera]|uniref:J domain-containing protein n=1 Tax=Vitis vinifera TaxID=29760 RepID=A0A438BSZ3_VITVI|nr:hypothetical protein CK203_099178 [Vitis vinifera]